LAKSFVAAALAAAVSAAVTADLVESLPEMTFDGYSVYSGYLPIPDTTNKLHYMFVES